jgi:hypothetical protein
MAITTPILIYSLKDIVSIFGEQNTFDVREVKADKKWIDAYNIQIDRVIRGRDIGELTHTEKKILNLLLHKCVYSSWNYILKKHCK